MIFVFFSVISAGVILLFFRLVKGPTAPDRAVALDALSTVLTASLVLLGFFFKRGVYLDVSLVYAVLAFIGSVAVARFLEKGI